MACTVFCHLSLFVCTLGNGVIAGDEVANDDADDLAKMTIPEEAEERDAPYRPSGGIPKKSEYRVGAELVGERRFYANGKLAEEKIYRAGRLHGYWRQYYETGHLFAARPYRDGKPNGTFRFYGEDGRLLGTSTIEDGNGFLREFPYTRLGALDSVIPYVDGKIDGKYRAWGRYARYETSGDRQMTVDGMNVSEYSAGKLHGWSATYDTEGRLIDAGYYQSGDAHGVIRMFDMHGSIVQGWPKYFVDGKEVARENYLRAAEADPLLKISLDKDRPEEAPDLARPES